jgi:beta-N-acetylhexosaminidase
MPQPALDNELRSDCHRVLLPVVSDLVGHTWLEQLLRRGASSILLGETRDEYVMRRMSSERRETETASQLREYVDAVSQWARNDLLVAVDQEPWGIQRLHGLVPSYLESSAIVRADVDDVRDGAQAVAEAAKKLGISMFLSPVVDVLDGPNPWLQGRTLQVKAPHEQVGSIAAAYVAGTQRGKVATVVKHFPGFPRLAHDPALEPTAMVEAGHWDERSLQPFDAVVGAGTAAVMLGPAIVADMDE